jgi:hypothetical protein
MSRPTLRRHLYVECLEGRELPSAVIAAQNPRTLHVISGTIQLTPNGATPQTNAAGGSIYNGN